MRALLPLCAAISTIVAPPVLAESISTPAVSPGPQVIDRPMRTGFVRGRTEPVDTIVLHSIFAEGHIDPYATESIIAVLRRFGVSAHYLIARDGTVYRLVAETDTSYHAGQSRMPEGDGRTGVNRFSIGIELVGGYDDHYTEAQYVSLEWLLRDIKTRHPIRTVVAHGEIASERRNDPWNFDWTRMREWIQNW